MALPATAGAISYGGGNSSNAPGQANALDNCEAAVMTQSDAGVSAGGGPKAGVPAPANCDHYFQTTGAIGGP